MSQQHPSPPGSHPQTAFANQTSFGVQVPMNAASAGRHPNAVGPTADSHPSQTAPGIGRVQNTGGSQKCDSLDMASRSYVSPDAQLRRPIQALTYVQPTSYPQDGRFASVPAFQPASRMGLGPQYRSSGYAWHGPTNNAPNTTSRTPNFATPTAQRSQSQSNKATLLTWFFVVLIWCADLVVATTFTEGDEGFVADLWYLGAISACFAVSVLLFRRAKTPIPVFRIMAVLSLVFPLSPAGCLTVLPSAIRVGKPKQVVADIVLAIAAASAFGMRDILAPQGAGVFDTISDETGEVTSSTLGFIVWLCVTICAISVCVGFVYRSNNKIALREQRSHELVQEVSGLRVELSRHHERETIAREVHDHVAHGISKIALHTNLAQMRTSDPAAAQALKEIRSLAQETMGGLRTVVTSLRDSTSEGYVGVAPTTFAEVQKLIDDTKNNGVKLRAIVSYGATDKIPPKVIQATYRIVQEGLTNAIKHAVEMPIYVSVNCFPRAGVHIEIVNELPEQGNPQSKQEQPGFQHNLSTGHGLIGMSERVAAVGGTFTSELSDEVWRLRAFLPLYSEKEIAK